MRAKSNSNSMNVSLEGRARNSILNSALAKKSYDETAQRKSINAGGNQAKLTAALSGIPSETVATMYNNL